jgi:hypothetical protein
MGSWGVLGPALLSLAGVALGAGGSLFGQYLVSRASARQLEIQESAAHRAELKNGGTAVDPVLDQLVDDLWLAQAEIDLVARSEPLRGAAYRYAARLAEAARGEIADASALRGPQVQFMDASYDDLWPGQRRAAGDSPAPS